MGGGLRYEKPTIGGGLRDEKPTIGGGLRVDLGTTESLLVLQRPFFLLQNCLWYSAEAILLVTHTSRIIGHRPVRANAGQPFLLVVAGQLWVTVFVGFHVTLSGRARDHEIQKPRVFAGLARRRSSIEVLQSRWPVLRR